MQLTERKKSPGKALELFACQKDQVKLSNTQGKKWLKLEKNQTAKDKTILTKIRTKFPLTCSEIQNSSVSYESWVSARAQRMRQRKNSLQSSILRSLPAPNSLTLQRERFKYPTLLKAGEFLEISPRLAQLVDNYTLENTIDFLNSSLLKKLEIGYNPLANKIQNLDKQIEDLEKEYENIEFELRLNNNEIEDAREFALRQEILEKQAKLLQ